MEKLSDEQLLNKFESSLYEQNLHINDEDYFKYKAELLRKLNEGQWAVEATKKIEKNCWLAFEGRISDYEFRVNVNRILREQAKEKQ
jgi:hypothetical protein